MNWRRIRGDARHALRALRHRNYRIYFVGQGLSLVGTAMQQLAMTWLVYRLTNSAFLLGFVAFAGQISSFVVTPFGGVVCDRWDRRKILLWTQTLSMLQALVLAGLTLAGIVCPWHIVTLSIFLGLVNGFDITCRQVLVNDMVPDKDDLASAVALSSTMFNLSRFLGPTAAGIVISRAGEGSCFFVNALSFAAVLVALLMMEFPERVTCLHRAPMHRVLVEGWDYVRTTPPLRDTLIMLSGVSLLGMPYLTILPVFAKESLLGGADVLGFLTSAMGLGATVGALWLASRRRTTDLAPRAAAASFMFGVCLVGFAVSKSIPMACLALTFVGFSQVVTWAASNTFIQITASDAMRGRVMSFYNLSWIGTSPVGSLLCGALAGTMGVMAAVSMNGVLTLVCSVWYWRRVRASDWGAKSPISRVPDGSGSRL